MTRVSWLWVSLVLFATPVWAIEIGFNEGSSRGGNSISQQYVKNNGVTDRLDTARLWVDLSASWEIEKVVSEKEDLSWTKLGDIKLVLFDILSYSRINGNTTSETSTRKAYGAIRVKNIYMAIGKQPIIWGVAKGVNPTNYLQRFTAVDKQIEPEISLEGVRSLVIEFPIKNFTMETIFANPDHAVQNATRFKTFAWDTDLSFSFFIDNDEDKIGNKIGGDFETDFHGLFGLYGEYAAGNIKDDYEFVGGISKVIPFFIRSSVNLEYQQGNIKAKKESTYTLQLSLLPMEELSLLSVVTYDQNTKVMFGLARIGYTIGRGEFALVSTYKLNDKDNVASPFEYIIEPKLIYYF